MYRILSKQEIFNAYTVSFIQDVYLKTIESYHLIHYEITIHFSCVKRIKANYSVTNNLYLLSKRFKFSDRRKIYDIRFFANLRYTSITQKLYGGNNQQISSMWCKEQRPTKGIFFTISPISIFATPFLYLINVCSHISPWNNISRISSKFQPSERWKIFCLWMQNTLHVNYSENELSSTNNQFVINVILRLFIQLSNQICIYIFPHIIKE